MPSDEESSKNPFIRFKQHVDSNISAGINTILPAKSDPKTQQPTPQGTATMSSQSDERGAPDPSRMSVWFSHQRIRAAQEELSDAKYAHAVNHTLSKQTHLHYWLGRFQGFMRTSPYSPLLLNVNSFLHGRMGAVNWSPKPHDMGSDMDPSLFSWVDAFEDLLADSQGLPMMPLRQRYKMNRSLRQRYPWGFETVPLSVWLRRLETQGVVKKDIFFGTGIRTSLPELKLEQEERLSRSDEDVDPITYLGQWAERKMGILESLFDSELRKIHEIFGTMTGEERDGIPKESNRERAPRDEQELYDFMRQQKSDIAAQLKERVHRSFGNANAETDNNGTEATSGDQPVVEKHEYVDKHGMLHSRTHIHRNNRDGSTSIEEELTVRPAPKDWKPSTELQTPSQEDTVIKNESEPTIQNENDHGNSKGSWSLWK